jgi:hypothetical protein
LANNKHKEIKEIEWSSQQTTEMVQDTKIRCRKRQKYVKI